MVVVATGQFAIHWNAIPHTRIHSREDMLSAPVIYLAIVYLRANNAVFFVHLCDRFGRVCVHLSVWSAVPWPFYRTI